MRRLIVIAIMILASVATGAGFDHSYPKIMIGGNGTFGTDHYTIKWLAQHTDGFIAGDRVLWSSIYTMATDSGKDYWTGPYASSQELNQVATEANGNLLSYAARLLEVGRWWQYNYAKHYLDSLGISAETLVVHIADAAVSITQQNDGNRSYSLSGLNPSETRFTYQYWNNTSADTFTYPAGYCWLANGYAVTTRKALAYAYRRFFIEDSANASWGTYSGKFHYNCYFMDNQYRDGASSRLSSYYSIVSTSGGPTSGLDWVEQPAIESNQDSLYKYYDSSTMMIDKWIRLELDSVCAANGWPKILGFANINKFDANQLGVVCRSGGVNAVSIENPIDWTKSAANWRSWYAMADTMQNHKDIQINWGLAGDILCSSDLYDWRHDSSRVYYADYSFFMTVMDTNAWFVPCRFNDTARWRDIYETNLGYPDGTSKLVDTAGSGDYTSLTYVARRYLDDSNNVVLFRTGNSSADYTTGTRTVALGGYYRQIDVNGDTAVNSVNEVSLLPWQGWIGTKGESPTDPIISRAPATFTFTATQGGSNPANQTLNISNSGVGTLDWGLTDNAAWLSLGTTSGENTGSSTVIVDISGLSPGDYNATITITDVHATNNPQTCSVSLHVDAASGDNAGKKPKVKNGRIKKS